MKPIDMMPPPHGENTEVARKACVCVCVNITYSTQELGTQTHKFRNCVSVLYFFTKTPFFI